MADSSLSGDATSAQEWPEQGVAQALLAPTQPKSLGFQLLYGLANAVIGFGNIVFYTILLPARIAIVATTNQTNTFIAISAIGAVASVLTNPLVGAFSDRTTAALGRRRPWLLIGAALMTLSMLIMAFAPNVLVLGVGAVILQIAINVLLAALSAIIPDQIPVEQRATVSAFSGMAPLFGGLIGIILVAQVIKNTFASFLILAFISALIIIVFTLVLREIRLPKGVIAPFRFKDVYRAFWINPVKYRDFAYVWLARCLVFLGATTLVNYMNYYLLDGVHYTSIFPGQTVAQGVQIFFSSYTIPLIIASLVCGILSDKFQRRKPFVIAASGAMAVGLLLFAFFPVWNMVIVASVIVGIGFGAYLSVDLALASQLLPEAKDRGKDLGIMNAAIFLPMLVGPAIAGIALGAFHSYAVLFVVLAVAAVLASVLILPIKKVR